MNLYNSKKLKTLKSKKLTVKCNTSGGQRRKSKQKTPNKKKHKQHKPSKLPTPSSNPPTISALSSVSKQQVPGAISQGPASASRVSGPPFTTATSALKSVQSARKARAASASAVASASVAAVSGISAAASGVSSLKPLQLPQSILPSAALVYNHRFCNIKSKKLNKQIRLSDNKPIFQEIVHDSKHILSSDPVIFKNLILFADKKYNDIIIDNSINILNIFNVDRYNAHEMYVRNVLRNNRVKPIVRANSTLPNNNNIVSTIESTLEKFPQASRKIARPKPPLRPLSKTPRELIDNSKNLIKYTADIELITSADIMNMLASMFFVYFNSSLDNTDCNKNEIAGIRIYDRINTLNNTVNYYEKKISNLDLRNKQEIVLVDYENYNIGMEDVTKLVGRRNIILNGKPFDIRDICKVHPNKLFIFIRTLKDRFRLYELVEKDKRYNNLLYINVFGRSYVGEYQNNVRDVDMEKGTYASIMTDDFLLIELYNFLTKKKFDVSIISRDKYDIIINKKTPKFNIYKYNVDRTGYNVEEIKVRNFQFYDTHIYYPIVCGLIAKPITNKNGVPIRINNLINAVNDIAATRYNSNYYHYFLLLIYILQNYAP